jgi:arginyl-tRNA synthetase
MTNMTHIRACLIESIQAAVQQSFPDVAANILPLNLEQPPQAGMGEFAFGCFPLTRLTGRPPKEIAETLQVGLTNLKNPLLDRIEASGPYLNLFINRAEFTRLVCQDVLTNQARFGTWPGQPRATIMIEYSAPNTNKPLHIGHVRNNLIGMTMSKMLEFAGYKVVKANLVNDRGIHICKSMLAYQEWGQGQTPQSEGIKGDHFVGKFYVRFEQELKKEREAYFGQHNLDPALLDQKKFGELTESLTKEAKVALKQKTKELENAFYAESRLYQAAQRMLKLWEEGDEATRAIWKQMNGWVYDGFKETYQVLGCEFDTWYFESDLYTLGKEEVKRGLLAGVFEERPDGSIWVTAERMKTVWPKSEKKQPEDKILLRGDGTSVYITQDIGTAIKKFRDFAIDSSIYVVADEQRDHFLNLFAILKLLGYDWAERCYHVSYGMVTLPKGMGKIKSREGTAVDADDLISEMTTLAKEIMLAGDVFVAPEKIDETSRAVALAALKVFILRVNRNKNIQFDPQSEIALTGDTGPAIQMSYARICSILRKASELGIVPAANSDFGLIIDELEFPLIRQIYNFPDMIQNVAKNYDSSLLVSYLFELSQAFARFFTDKNHSVIHAETPALKQARLTLCKVVQQTLENGLTLLGIRAIERM